MGLFDDAKRLKSAIEDIAREVIARETRDCFRVRKAVVTTAPDSGTGLCGVTLVGDATELFLPYVSGLASASVGDAVWVAILGASMRNAVVWQNATLSA